jgi:hypothetical protein
MADVFISYSHKDSDYAHRLADELRSRQVDVWIDDRIDYGDQWPRVIQDNLAACRVFIVVMSPRSFNSMWVQNEVSYAQANRKSIFPLLLEGDVWLSMSAMQFVDVQTGEIPPEKFFDRLARELNKPVPPAPRPPKKLPPKPGISQRRQWMYIGGSLLLLVGLFVLIPILRGILSPEPTPLPARPLDVTPGGPTEPIITKDLPDVSPTTQVAEITEPSPQPTFTLTPIYNSGVITFITNTESGQVLYILDGDGSQRTLVEEPGIQGLQVLSVSPPSNDSSSPRYLAVSFVKDSQLHVVVLNAEDGSSLTVVQGVDSAKATHIEDGRLLIEIKNGNQATYSLFQMDGSDPVEIYNTVLSLPTSSPTNTPGSAP